MTDAAAADNTESVDDSRRKFLTYATTAAGAVGVVFAATPFIASWNPSERARAAGLPVEVDLSKLAPGQMTQVVWRKQPIYIVNRPKGLVDKLAAHDDMLKDPASKKSEQPDYANNEMRSRNAEFLVLIGTCTHLGCLPKQRFEPGDPRIGAYWPGGFFCPCHGSRFDLAGRVFDGSPASTNLRVPPYYYKSPMALVVGEDGSPAKGAA